MKPVNNPPALPDSIRGVSAGKEVFGNASRGSQSVDDEGRISRSAVVALILGPLTILLLGLALMLLYSFGRDALVAGSDSENSPESILLGSGEGEEVVSDEQPVIALSGSQASDSQKLTSESMEVGDAVESEQDGDRGGPSDSVVNPSQAGIKEEAKSEEDGVAVGGSTEKAGESSDSSKEKTGTTAPEGNSSQAVVRTFFSSADPPPPSERRIAANGVNPFMIAEDSASTVFVIDKSSSMDGVAFVQVCNAMLDAMNSLSPNQQYAVVFFDTQAVSRPRLKWSLSQATPSNIKSSEKFMGLVNPSGGTDPTEAVKMAIQLRPEKIIVLSDGDFSANLVQAISNMNSLGPKSEIHAVGLKTNVPTLRALAKQNRGTYTTAK